MKRVLKWIGIVLAGLVGLVLLTAVILHFVGLSRLNNAPEVATKPVSVPTDTAAVARGEHLVNVVSSCGTCHGENLGGQVFFDGEVGSYVFAANLTAGAGGVAATFSDADWERAIRHGVGSDGRVLVIMPSNFYQHYSDADLGAMIAYLKAAPPIDNDLGVRRIGFPGSAVGGTLGFNDFTRINGIDHANVGANSPAAGATVEYGAYLVQIAACGELLDSQERYVGLFDREAWPARLAAHVVSPDPEPRLHGYAVAGDLARFYGLGLSYLGANSQAEGAT